MKSKSNPFSRALGLVVQEQDVARWATKLNDETLGRLRAELEIRNAALADDADGYDVWRGNQITEWILNCDLKTGNAYTFVV